MVQFKKYKTKKGETRYQFQTYLGKVHTPVKIKLLVDVDLKRRVKHKSLIQD